MSSISLKSSDFPTSLVEAVGSKQFEAMPQMIVENMDQLKIRAIERSGPIKGIDLEKNLFVSFVAKQGKNRALFVISNERVRIRTFENLKPLAIYGLPMDEYKYLLIKVLFAGKYQDISIPNFSKK
jgi:hypothetical protein